MASSTTSSENEISLSWLKPPHADDVQRIAHASFPDRWKIEEILHFIEHPCGLCMGAFRTDGALVAYLLSYLVQGDLDIVSVATEPSRRRQGLAARLLRRVWDGPGVKRVMLEVAVDNAPAIALYKKLGFEIKGLRRKYYRGTGDAHFMTKEID